jgi:hypothetical protein
LNSGAIPVDIRIVHSINNTGRCCLKSLLFSLMLLLTAASASVGAQIECPQGFTHNSEGGYCESLPGCPPGFNLDSEDPVCIATPDTQKRCPDNSSVQAGKDRCESKTTCPEGSLFDPSIEKCLIRQ